MTTAYFAGPAEDPDRYQLTELRSRGGEGELWVGWVRAGDQQLPVAVKVFHPSASTPIEVLAERVRGQAEILRSLEHPNLIKVRESFLGAPLHAYSEANRAQPPSLYLVMNWAPGESLETWVARNPDRDPLQCARIVSRLADGVEELHSGRATGGMAVVHRDIKPANVMVNGDEVRLVDFGLARFATGDIRTIAGTPAYLAPELLGGAQPSPASDRFGLGGVAYYVFTGTAPDMSNPGGMRAALMAVPGITDREGFAAHVMAMLHPDPARRPSNVLEWAQGLAVGTVSRTFAMPATVAQPAVMGQMSQSFEAPLPPPRGGNGGRIALISAIVAIVAVLGVVVALAATRGGDDSNATASTTTTEETTTSTSSTSTTSTTLDEPSTTTSLDDTSPGGINPAGTIQYLADSAPVQKENVSFDSGQGNLSGTVYTRSLLMGPAYADPGAVEYDLARKYSRLKASVGVTDSAKSTTQFKVEIFLDGAEVFDQTVKLGAVVPVDIDVTHVLRLRIQVTQVDSNIYNDDYAIVADPKLYPADAKAKS